MLEPTLEPTGTVDGVIDHFRKPIYNRAYALIVSSAVTAVLGLGFWTLAAHLYGASELGINAAVISAMMFLSFLAQLSLAGALTRFIPTAGKFTRRLVLASYGVAVLITAVVATVFVIGAGLWAPQLRPLVADPLAAAWFVAAAMAWSLFALQDAVLTGLRRTMWVPIENTIFAVIKIVALVALAGSLTGSGIYVSWTVPAALSIVPINFMIFRWFLPKHLARHGKDEPEAGARTIVHYLAFDNAGSLLVSASTGLLPLIVLATIGPLASAYYYIAWTIAYSMQLFSLNMAISLSVEGAGERSELARGTRRMFKLLVGLQVPLVAAIVVAAPVLLQVFGREYSDQGAMLLRLLALGVLPHGINSVCLGVARVRRQLRVLFAVQAAQAILFVVLTIVLLPTMGLAGVGVAFLVGQSIVAAVAFTQIAPLLRPGLLARGNSSSTAPRLGGIGLGMSMAEGLDPTQRSVTESLLPGSPLTVVIPVRNAENFIDECLASVVAAGPAEIIVVDGRSTDRTLEIVAKYNVRVVSDEGRGVAAARMIGVQEATSEYVALIDADIVLSDGALASLLDEFREGGYSALQAGLHSSAGPGYWGQALARHHNTGRSRNWMGVMATILRRETLLEYPLDSTFLSGEDIDLRWRLNRSGVRIGVSSRTVVSHRFGDTLEFARAQWRDDGAGLARMALTHSGGSLLLLMPVADAVRGVALTTLRLEPQYIPYYLVHTAMNYRSAVGILWAAQRDRRLHRGRAH
jgi:glycosyltransferase involved in cell wall biosynthesis/O-antigen/teichoic acid export membrane protein